MTISLPVAMDTPAATPLLAALRERIDQGQPVTIDAAQVEQAGQACLQVLLAARNAARNAGLAFRIERPSAPLVEMATLAALDVLDPA